MSPRNDHRLRRKGDERPLRPEAFATRLLAPLRRFSLVFLCLPLVGLAQAGPQKRVFVLFDGAREFSNIEYLGQSLDSVIRPTLNQDIVMYREYMDLTRIAQPDYEPLLKDFYRKKYANDPPDVIVAVRSRALDFLLKYGAELFPDVPIISMGMDLRQVRARQLPPRVTGVALRVAYRPTLDFALALQPATKHVAVVLGSTPSDHALEALVRDEFGRIENPPEFTYLAGLSLDDLLKRVGSLPPNSVVLFVSFARDALGHSYYPNDAVSRVAQAANAPTFIPSDDVKNMGAVGGDLIYFGGLGQTTGKLVLRILGGESPAHIPFTEYAGRVKLLDARQQERWKIPAGNIPAGTAYSFRAPTAWELYRWQIIAGVALILSQSVLIMAILLHRKRRLAAERALARSEAAKHSAVLEERNRLARDIHDSLAQGFTGVIIQLGAARKAFAQASVADAHQHIESAEETARESLGEARRSIKALRPNALERGNLAIVLSDLIRKMTAETGVQTEFAAVGEPAALDPQVEETLLRVHQEILTNALRHSGATLVSTKLVFGPDDIRLEVRDNGRGFDSTAPHDGYGLVGIRERIALMNGRITIETAPACGTRYDIVLPAARKPHEAPVP
jgi:signal transduction histidine kinase